MPPDALHRFAGPVLITLVYLTLYYATQIWIARVKTSLDREYAAKGEKFDRYYGQDRRMLAADRVQLNMLEHMPPFLVLLWLHAVFVGPGTATVAGAVYLASRIAYPFVMGPKLGRGIRARVLLATVPGYLVLIFLSGGLVMGLVRG